MVKLKYNASGRLVAGEVMQPTTTAASAALCYHLLKVRTIF
jgi:hypothetical protein